MLNSAECELQFLSRNRCDWSGSPMGAIAKNGHNSGAGFGAGLYRNLVRLSARGDGRPNPHEYRRFAILFDGVRGRAKGKKRTSKSEGKS
jgi:hypothetical protein